MMKNCIGVVVICLFFYACGAIIPSPMASDAVRAESRWKGTTLQNLAEGRRLYILKCSGCHSLRSPSLLTEEKWQEQIIEMQKKAEISDQESTAILRYLLTMRILPKEEKAY